MPLEGIANLPAGAHLFLDANIFIYAFLGHSIQCRNLLGRCASEQVFGITSFEVVNEVTHRLMVAEALGTGVIKRDRVRDLRGKRREIAELTEYWAQTSAIFGLNILVLPSDEARLHRAQSVRSRYGLLTNDSLILAAMEENGLESLATATAILITSRISKFTSPPIFNTVRSFSDRDQHRDVTGDRFGHEHAHVRNEHDGPPFRRLEPLELWDEMNSQTGDFNLDSFSVSFMFSE